jgi:hypothetical protein
MGIPAMTRTAIAALLLSTAAVFPTAAKDGEPVPRAVTVARATAIPNCTVFVDAAAPARGDGTVKKPHKTVSAAVAAAENGAVICVAEGNYPEQVKPDTKYFTLAGDFQSGKEFKVRDSARYASKARGNGTGSFIYYENEGNKGDQLVAIDGFEISGYSQAIVRKVYYSGRFDITNNFIHDNKCSAKQMAGAGFSLSNTSGRIEGNVFRNNSCDRGGAGAVDDDLRENTITIRRNHVDASSGTEAEKNAHGGGLYLFGKDLRVSGNLFTGNFASGWGGGLYIGAWIEGKKHTTARLSWNVYRKNRAGIFGGGLFCDDGAACISEHEIFEANCGGNIYLDSGDKAGPTTARFNHLTNVGGLDVDCKTPGGGVLVDNSNGAPDNYTFTNALFWGNAKGRDFVVSCNEGEGACRTLKVNISHSMVQTEHLQNGAKATFGAGIVAPADPLFADAEKGDFHLKSAAGRWTPSGFVEDTASSPAIGKGDKRLELGAYGNSAEASKAP